MLDFDNIDDWAPELKAALSQHVPNSVEQKLVEAKPEFIEDALHVLFDLADRNAIINATMDWLRSRKIACYHGSRLTDEEVESILGTGLIPLEAESRRDRLISALSSHPKWPEVGALQIDDIIRDYGRHNRTGRREGQVHLTLSRAGLVDGFNHYLTYGSEFDQQVAQKILGTEGKELLADYGKPRVFQVAVPGDLALKFANPYFTVDDCRADGKVPNLVREFLESWIYRLTDPSFQSRTLKVDCGLVFDKSILASCITDFETLSET